MKLKCFVISMLSIICCLSWSVSVVASHDPTIERVQLELTAKGYEPGPADGEMREETGAAIRKYQEENKLEVTGTADEATLKKLSISSPEVTCSGTKCTIKYGLTDEGLEEVKRYLSEDEWASEVKLSLGTNTDLKKLPALAEFLTRLEVADSDYITDITPLGELPNLETLRLSYLKSLTDLTALKNLQGLKELSLAMLGQPVDIAPLAPLANLETLILGMLNLDIDEPLDSSALAGKPHLKKLRLTLVKFDDLSALQDSAELKEVHLERLPVSDVSFLKACKNITRLSLLDFPVTDLSPVGELTELIVLHLGELEVTDLAFLKTLKKLEHLSFTDIPAMDLSPVAELTGLKAIFFSAVTAVAAFDDYAPLANCTNLEVLQAKKGTGFHQLDVIRSMPNLKNLYLDDNTDIQQWDALATATNLEILSVKGTSFSDLSLLSNMPKLHSLALGECTVTHVEAILDNPIKRLDIRGTQGFDDLTVFKALPTLAKLSVQYKNDQFPQEQIDALKAAIKEAKEKKE